MDGKAHLCYEVISLLPSTEYDCKRRKRNHKGCDFSYPYLPDGMVHSSTVDLFSLSNLAHMKHLTEFSDRELSEQVFKVFGKHLWCLGEELVGYCFFQFL